MLRLFKNRDTSVHLNKNCEPFKFQTNMQKMGGALFKSQAGSPRAPQRAYY